MAQRDEKGRFVRTKPDYKAMYEEKCEEYNDLKAKYDATIAVGWNENPNVHIEFLLDHAGPILRWRYNRKFKKGE